MKTGFPESENSASETVQAVPAAPTASSAAVAAVKPERRSHSKVAQLPKPLRELVNSMLDDGHPYAAIIARLEQSTDPPLPFPISEMNISRWYDGGYQAHLDKQERLAAVRENREAALELVEGGDTISLPEATLQLVTSQIFQMLGDFSSASLKEKLAEDPLKYIRLINSFAHISRETMVLKKYREASARTAVLELKRLDPEREFSDREHEIFASRMDDLFLRPRRRPPGEAAPNTAPAPAPQTDPTTPHANDTNI